MPTVDKCNTFIMRCDVTKTRKLFIVLDSPERHTNCDLFWPVFSHFSFQKSTPAAQSFHSVCYADATQSRANKRHCPARNHSYRKQLFNKSVSTLSSECFAYGQTALTARLLTDYGFKLEQPEEFTPHCLQISMVEHYLLLLWCS